MRVVHLLKSDLKGGAHIAAYRLHKSLQLIGVDSLMIVDEKISDDKTVIGPQSIVQKISGYVTPRLDYLPHLLNFSSNNEPSSYSWIPDKIASRVVSTKPDVINLHWINNGFMRVESLIKFRDMPVVWTLHDMWPFCGIKHYSSDDKRYIYGYLPENRPKNEAGFDFNRWLWNRKNKVFKGLRNFTAVAPSNWMGECAKKSAMFHDKKIRIIPYGINQDIFKPEDQLVVKKGLGLPNNKKLVLFGAVNGLKDNRKGFDLLQAAIKLLVQKRNDVELIVFGSSKPNATFNMGCKLHIMGKIQDEEKISSIYNAADVFVVPSREDNLPNTVLEALSCGTPVVAFRIGGIPDMIEHKKNGYLAKPFEIQELADGIIYVLKSKENWENLSRVSRGKILTDFNFELQARRYLDLYEGMLKV